MIWLIVGAILIAFGVYLDVLSMRLYLARNANGHGPSGVPLVGLVLYFIVLLVWEAPLTIKLTTLGLFTAFHVVMQYFISLRDMLFRKKH